MLTKPQVVPCSLLDGDPVDDGYGYSFPNGKKPNGDFTFDDCVFNDPSQALFYLEIVKKNSPQFVTWLQLHCKRDLKIEEPISMSPDPRLLAKYRRDGKGLSVPMFRDHGNSRKIVERIKNLPIDLRVWIPQEQVNHEECYYDTITGQSTLAQMLLQEHIAQGKPVPKGLLDKTDQTASKQEEENRRSSLQQDDEQEEAETDALDDKDQEQEEDAQASPKRKGNPQSKTKAPQSKKTKTYIPKD